MMSALYFIAELSLQHFTYFILFISILNSIPALSSAPPPVVANHRVLLRAGTLFAVLFHVLLVHGLGVPAQERVEGCGHRAGAAGPRAGHEQREGARPFSQGAPQFLAGTLNAAGVFGMPVVIPGAAADVCIFDAKARTRISAEHLKSQGKNTPFNGLELKGRVTHTLVAGQIAYETK